MDIYEQANNIGCGSEVDHILPVAKGGLTVPWNLQILAMKDNRAKSDKVDVASQRIISILKQDIAFLERLPDSGAVATLVAMKTGQLPN